MRPHEPDEGSQDKDLQRARARIGKVLRGKYRVDRLLGVGGMASVFSATHLRNANCVAVKILHSGLAIEPDLRARFLREGYASNSVGHPGTVRVLDDDTTEDGALFLVMELLDGETLDARWERSHHKLGVREVVTLVSELLDVLAAAHAKGIVHRDIKPENLFLTREGKVKVLDFGVARLREASATRTGSGAVFGTPAFMPPEQALGRVDEVDALSDVWAVGATAFLLLSGRFVHEAATAAEFVVRAATLKAPPLTSVAPEVPGPVAHVIDRALAFDKDDRWASASAMRDALVKAWGDGAGATVDDAEIERDDLTRLAPASRAVKAGEGSDEGDLGYAPAQARVVYRGRRRLGQRGPPRSLSAQARAGGSRRGAPRAGRPCRGLRIVSGEAHSTPRERVRLGPARSRALRAFDCGVDQARRARGNVDRERSPAMGTCRSSAQS